MLSRAAVLSAAMLSIVAFWAACRAPGLRDGAACTRATHCESLVCSFQLPQDAGPDGEAQGTCVGRCSETTGCSNGLVCGRYDFRGIVPDSGGPDVEQVREGPDFEVLRACRPPLNDRCENDSQCRAGMRCFGGPDGRCGFACTRSSQCPTRLCLTLDGREACNEPGVCMPECDHSSECSSNAYCQFSYSNSVHGRCALRALPDASVCPLPDASADSANDASDASETSADSAVSDAAAGMDASAPDGA